MGHSRARAAEQKGAAKQNEESGILTGATSISGGLKLAIGGQSRKQIENLNRRAATTAELLRKLCLT
jgi:hypothetical protein